MQLGGMKPTTSFDLTVGITGLMAISNMCCWVFVEKFGRRLLILVGMYRHVPLFDLCQIFGKIANALH